MNIFKSRRKKHTPSANTHQQDTWKIQSSASENLNLNSNSNKPTTNEEITGTPFRLIHLPDHGWFISLGMMRITKEIYKTKEEAMKLLEERDWQTICNVIVTLIDQVNQMTKTAQTQQQ